MADESMCWLYADHIDTGILPIACTMPDRSVGIAPFGPASYEEIALYKHALSRGERYLRLGSWPE